MGTPIAGKVSSLEVSTNGGSTWTLVTGRVDMTLNLNKGEIEASHMDGGDWSNYLAGRKDATVDFTLRYMEDDPGQVILIDNYFGSGTEIDVRFRLQTGTGKNQFSGKGIVTSLSPAPGDEAPTDMSGTIRINGALTKAAQA